MGKNKFTKYFFIIPCLALMVLSVNFNTAFATNTKDVNAVIGGLINILGGQSASKGALTNSNPVGNNTVIHTGEDMTSKMFFLALANKDYAVMEEQLHKGFKINALYAHAGSNTIYKDDGIVSPFYSVFIRRDRESMQWMLEHGANVTGFIRGGKHVSYIVEAAGWFDLNTVQYLHGWGADINSESTAKGIPNQSLHDNALNFAIDTKSVSGMNHEVVEISQYLIANGIDVNHRNVDGDTPLHQVVSRAESPKMYNLLNVLLDAGADIQAKDKKGRTVMERAIDSNNYGFVKQLREHK